MARPGKLESLLNDGRGRIRESASLRTAPAAMPGLGGPTIPAPSARDAGVVRSKVAQVIPVDRIIRDPLQPREEFDEEALHRLADSLRLRGMLQPIAVRWDEGQGAWVVVVGERRWRASKIAGLASIPCTVIDREFGPGELLAVQCMENLLREDLKPIEQAKAFRTLLEANGWSAAQLARELSVTPGHVSQALKLLSLPEKVQEDVDAGRLPASSGWAIATKVADPATQEALAGRVIAEDLSREATVRVVEETIRARPEVAQPPKKGRGAKIAKVTTTESRAAHERQGRAGESAAEAKSATIAPPLTYTFDTDPDITVTLTIAWKQPITRPLPRIKGDVVRWVKSPDVLADGPDVPKAAQANDAGQGGEAGSDAGAAQGQDADAA